MRLKEPFSGLSHLVGGMVGVGILAFLFWRSLHGGTLRAPIAILVFGVSFSLLYLSSALYHLLHLEERLELLFRQLDHSMIFVFIAGSYTPFCILALRGTVGWTLLTVVWALALGGLFIKIFWMHAPRTLSTALYLGMGWMSVLVVYPLSQALSVSGMCWLVAGGLFYTIGAVIYSLERPDPFPSVFGFHEIWHCLVLAGSYSHFVSVATLLG